MRISGAGIAKIMVGLALLAGAGFLIYLNFWGVPGSQAQGGQPTPAAAPLPLPTVTPVLGGAPSRTPLQTPTALPGVSPTPLLASTPTPALSATVPAPTPTPTPVTLEPKKIRIPAVGIEAPVEKVGLTPDGKMDIPKDIWNTAWYGNGGYRPGDFGNAAISGHVDGPSSKAVFWDLHKLKAGDRIFLSDQGGKEMVFEVTRTQVYAYNDAPMLEIFGPSPEPHLNLITCAGTWDRNNQNYDKRLVVFSKLVKVS